MSRARGGSHPPAAMLARRLLLISSLGGAALIVAAAIAPVLGEDVQIVPPPSRDVTPPGMTPGPSGSGPLEREPVPPPPPEPPRWHRFELPVTTDAATLVIDNRTIRIAGVKARPRSETCRMADGEDWPCGESALYSLRQFLHGRPVECFLGPQDTGRDLTLACRVGPTDLGLWLLTAGWADPGPEASDQYRHAASVARCARVGLWRGMAEPSDCPAPVAAGAAAGG